MIAFMYYHQTIKLNPHDKILTHTITKINGQYMGYSLQSMQLKSLPSLDIVKKSMNPAMTNCSQCHKN